MLILIIFCKFTNDILNECVCSDTRTESKYVQTYNVCKNSVMWEKKLCL